MPFIGNQPAESYSAFQKQDFSTSATTSYTLDNPVANANELALFINFVRQEPTTAYSASGTSLTLTSATASSDDMYCVYLGKAVQTVNPPNASVGLSQLTATGTKDATTFLRGDNTFDAPSLDFKSLLSASSGTNVSEVVFDDLDVSTYSHFMLVWFSQPTSDNSYLYFQMRTGGSSGANFTTGAYDSAVFGTSADNTYYSTHEINQDHWRVHQNAGNNTVEYHQSQIFFTPFKSGNQAYLGNFMRAQGTRYDSSGNFRPEFSGGAYNHSDYPAATGFRIYYHTGDINKYNYKLYGIV